MIQEESQTFDPEKPIERKERFWTERRYKIVNYIGLSINLAACAVLGCFRSKEDYVLFLTGSVPHLVNWWVLRLYLF